SGVSLPATGRADRTETGSQEGDAGGVASTSGVPDYETDSVVGADSDGTDPGEGSQPASVSEQAAVLGLLWIGGGEGGCRGGVRTIIFERDRRRSGSGHR